MKKTITSILISFMLLANISFAQRADFENINVGTKGYYNGSDWAGGFSSGPAFFVNEYDTAFGFESWGGFAVSAKTDSSTPGFLNQYSAITGGGYNSTKYAVVYGDAKIRLNSNKVISGFYFTNNTYAYFDMKLGSQFSKKFGGASGNDPDYLKVIISAWKNSGNPADTTLEIYLADFRDSNNTNDYIIRNWTWADLSIFGAVDSFAFNFASSDTGDFGINTPVYFCLDNFNDTPIGIEKLSQSNTLDVYPNPTLNKLTIGSTQKIEKITLSDNQGKILIETSLTELDLSNLSPGIYFITAEHKQGITTQKVVKQ